MRHGLIGKVSKNRAIGKYNGGLYDNLILRGNLLTTICIIEYKLGNIKLDSRTILRIKDRLHEKYHS